MGAHRLGHRVGVEQIERQEAALVLEVRIPTIAAIDSD
jgi:hypothetical protein